MPVYFVDFFFRRLHCLALSPLSDEWRNIIHQESQLERGAEPVDL